MTEIADNSVVRLQLGIYRMRVGTKNYTIEKLRGKWILYDVSSPSTKLGSYASIYKAMQAARGRV